MHQRLAARNRNHRRATLVYRPEALLGRQVLLEHVRRILNLAATGTRQVAANQRLPLPPLDSLLQDVSSRRPHLRNWYTHSAGTFLEERIRTRTLFRVCTG